jgi:hypothetical protein
MFPPYAGERPHPPPQGEQLSGRDGARRNHIGASPLAGACDPARAHLERGSEDHEPATVSTRQRAAPGRIPVRRASLGLSLLALRAQLVSWRSAMPEERKRGFQGLEQRIKEMEAEDARREREAKEEKKEAPRSEPNEKESGVP